MKRRSRSGWCPAADKPCPKFAVAGYVKLCPVSSVDNFGRSYPGCALMRLKTREEVDGIDPSKEQEK